MPLETTHTILTLTDSVSLLPFYSGQGLRQTMEYIDGATVQGRTVNAELVNLGLDRFRKLRTVISAKDIRPPSIDAVYPGRVVLIGCATIFNYPTVGGTAGRPVVAGSQFVQGDFTFYRPLLTCMLGKPTGAFDEWEADHEWSITAEEI